MRQRLVTRNLFRIQRRQRVVTQFYSPCIIRRFFTLNPPPKRTGRNSLSPRGGPPRTTTREKGNVSNRPLVPRTQSLVSRFCYRVKHLPLNPRGYFRPRIGSAPGRASRAVRGRRTGRGCVCGCRYQFYDFGGDRPADVSRPRSDADARHRRLFIEPIASGRARQRNTVAAAVNDYADTRGNERGE